MQYLMQVFCTFVKKTLTLQRQSVKTAFIMEQHFDMVAKTFKGLESVLARELEQLGAENVNIQRRAVAFTGGLRMLYRANMCLRTASRVLVPIAAFRANDADGVYARAKEVDWSLFMSVSSSFSIDATVYSEEFRHSRYVTYRVKDAIADWWTEHAGKRPSVQLSDPDLRLNVHIAGTEVTLSLDSSGESLHKRGYRVANTEAPINEALAAGMLLLAGWHGQCDFYDPMCGSGTLPIEAALIARNIAPGIFRQSFAFEYWRDFDAELWSEIYNDDSAERPFTHHIYGSDASFFAIQQATKNVRAASLQKDIELRQIRLEELKITNSESQTANTSALVMINPPYGERLASNKDMEDLYSRIGTVLKHQFAGSTAWIISSNEVAMKCIGLKPSKKLRLLNGELDCQFNRYDLFQGKRKENLNS
jgi:putative N6-adenine-specific DNA methylase